MKKTMSREVDLGNEPVRHLLLVLAVPAITSQVVNALYNMVDRMSDTFRKLVPLHLQGSVSVSRLL